MYRNILVPLDGSKRAERIVPFVEELARMKDGTVIFLQVMDSPTMMVGPYDTSLHYDRETAERLIADTKTYLAGLVGEMRERGIAARYVVNFGPAVNAILEVAQRELVDLIAMASHGRTGLARVFYGSVAAGIMQQTDRPLLLIRSGDEVHR